jgi:hypothetical protein
LSRAGRLAGNLLVALSLLVVAACGGAAPPTAEPSPIESPPDPTPTVEPTPARTPEASPTASPTLTPISLSSPTPGAESPAPQFGLPSVGCINGWQSPASGSPAYEDALGLISFHLPEAVTPLIVEMRHFIGPEVPWMTSGTDTVERWYVRTEGDQAAGRWLLERRSALTAGVAAIVPATTTGYESPDWTGFVGEGSRQVYPSLPGEWFGIPYDFVTGEGDSGQPGLPDEAVDCLAGT